MGSGAVTGDRELPNGKEIAAYFGRKERRGRLVKQCGSQVQADTALSVGRAEVTLKISSTGHVPGARLLKGVLYSALQRRERSVLGEQFSATRRVRLHDRRSAENRP